jgi:DNA-binding XRE family transcriptional regulator
MAETHFGDKIRALRESAGLLQDELAWGANIAVTTLQKIESCKTDPQIGTIAKIASVLGVPITEIFVDQSGKLLIPAEYLVGVRGAKTNLDLAVQHKRSEIRKEMATASKTATFEKSNISENKESLIGRLATIAITLNESELRAVLQSASRSPSLRLKSRRKISK